MTTSRRRGHVRHPASRLILAAAATVAVATATSPARSQQSCPPGSKALATTCVQTCPAGYEDNGRSCEFRRQSSGGGGP